MAAFERQRRNLVDRPVPLPSFDAKRCQLPGGIVTGQSSVAERPRSGVDDCAGMSVSIEPYSPSRSEILGRLDRYSFPDITTRSVKSAPDGPG